MNFDQLKDNWQRFGLEDPRWAISTDPSGKDDRWEPEPFFQIGRDTVAASMQPVLALRPDLGRGRALDFGCGAGRLTKGLATFFDEVVGVDVVITRPGGTLLRIEENGRAGSSVRSFTYLVAKQG